MHGSILIFFQQNLTINKQKEREAFDLQDIKNVREIYNSYFSTLNCVDDHYIFSRHFKY